MKQLLLPFIQKSRLKADCFSYINWVLDKADESYKSFRPKKITDIRLKQIKKIVFGDEVLWQELIVSHGALDKTPNELKEMSPSNYNQARANFWAMIREKIQRQLA